MEFDLSKNVFFENWEALGFGVKDKHNGSQKIIYVTR